MTLDSRCQYIVVINFIYVLMVIADGVMSTWSDY